jgi:hypothetical protein
MHCNQGQFLGQQRLGLTHGTVSHTMHHFYAGLAANEM